MLSAQRFHTLVAAVHTPFNAALDLDLRVVENQADHLLRNGVDTVFVCGTTGECASLRPAERLALSGRWLEIAKGCRLQVVVHVGSNCLAESCELAADAARRGARAISAFAPSYFKPRTLEDLVAWCEPIAAAAPGVPFYYYDIPALTGVSFPMPDFLALAARRIPTLAGLKFTNPDLAAYQECLHADAGRWDLPFGVDEQMLAALVLGARGAVGSGYNFAAAVYRRLLAAFTAGGIEAAREEQWRGVMLVRTLAGFGYLAASKWLMGELGVPVGPARHPLRNLTTDETTRLHRALDALGFFRWIQ